MIKNRKTRKRLTAVFLVCMAFVMCSMIVFADAVIVNNAKVQSIYNSPLDNDLTTYVSGVESDRIALAIDFDMWDFGTIRLYVETDKGDIIVDFFTEDTPWSVEIVDSSTFGSNSNIMYYSTTDTPVSDHEGTIYVYISFGTSAIVNNVYSGWVTSVGPLESSNGVRNSIYVGAPNILSSIGTVTDTVIETSNSFATLIIEHPLLLLMSAALPVVSFGAGMLLMLFKKGR